MPDVVHAGSRYWSEADLHAISLYLLDGETEP